MQPRADTHIGFEKWKDIPYAQKCANNGNKSKRSDVSCKRSTPILRFCVQIDQKDKPRDQRPRLFWIPAPVASPGSFSPYPVSYTHLRAHETDSYLVCRLLL